MNRPQNDDEKFEHLLKQFRPRAPRRLRIEGQERAARRGFAFGLLAATAVVLVVAVLIIGNRRMHAPNWVQNPTSVQPATNPEPLTLGKANALLMQAPSMEEAVDSLAFQSGTADVPKGERSALATLAQENFKEKL